MQTKVDSGFDSVLYKNYIASQVAKSRSYEEPNTSDMQKYPTTFDLPAGQAFALPLPLDETHKPYTWELLDANGNNITGCILGVVLVDGYWNINMYSETAYPNSQLLITY
jgi:hypothetical protein